MLWDSLIASPQHHVDYIPISVRGMFKYHLGGGNRS